MKCPNCKKTVSPNVRSCRHCGSRFVRKSDKLVRGIALTPRLAFICGGMLGFMGVALLFLGAWTMGALACGLGFALAGIGKAMQ